MVNCTLLPLCFWNGIPVPTEVEARWAPEPKRKSSCPCRCFEPLIIQAVAQVTVVTEISRLPSLPRRTFRCYDWCTLVTFRASENKKIYHFFLALNSSLQIVLSDSSSWAVMSPAFQVMFSKCMAHASEPFISWQWINKMTALPKHCKVYSVIY
jgi:hypothetical protein